MHTRHITAALAGTLAALSLVGCSGGSSADSSHEATTAEAASATTAAPSTTTQADEPAAETTSAPEPAAADAASSPKPSSTVTDSVLGFSPRQQQLLQLWMEKNGYEGINEWDTRTTARLGMAGASLACASMDLYGITRDEALTRQSMDGGPDDRAIVKHGMQIYCPE